VARADAQAASILALLATYQAVAAGQDPKMLSDAVDGLRKASPGAESATPEAVDKALDDARARYGDVRAARAKAAAAMAQQQQQQQQQAQSPSMADVAGDIDPRLRAGVSAIGSLQRGDIDGAAHDAIQLLPEGSPLRSTAESVEALVHGDFKGALRSAAKILPPYTPVGAVLSLAAAVFG
jgi:hypothetical protein